MASILAGLPPHVTSDSEEEECVDSEERGKRQAWRRRKRVALEQELQRAESLLKDAMAATGKEMVDIDVRRR